LLKIVRRVLKQADRGQQQVTDSAYTSAPRQQKWLGALAHYRDLASRVIEQTERRVIQGERVPSSDKIVSLFEPHTDIIVKGFRDVQYAGAESPGKDMWSPGKRTYRRPRPGAEHEPDR